jgi:uncharacterized protein
MRFELYRDRARQWRWRLVAANGRIMADSAEAYTRKRDCVRALQTIQALELWRVEVRDA